MTANKIVAVSLQAISAALFVASFIVPPVGIINSSILTAGGIMTAGSSLFFLWDRAESGADAHYKRGDTEIHITN